MDEFIDSLLRDERVCGVALPRLPKRDVLQQGGYLEGPRISSMHAILWPESNTEFSIPDDLDSLKACADRIETVLDQMARAGNKSAQKALDQRRGVKQNRKDHQLDEETQNKSKLSKDHRLFKKATIVKSEEINRPDQSSIKNDSVKGDTIEHSDDYWNEQRKLLGLKPLH
jgi:hypothetical protein